MESFNQNVIKHKTGLLNLAAELGNISKACKIMGFSRDTFYRYQAARDEGGVEALFDVSMRWVVNFVRHAMRPSELINPVAFVQMLPGRCTPVQLAAAACCKKFLYIQ